jgi:hypothetical protein
MEKHDDPQAQQLALPRQACGELSLGLAFFLRRRNDPKQGSAGSFALFDDLAKPVKSPPQLCASYCLIRPEDQ